MVGWAGRLKIGGLLLPADKEEDEKLFIIVGVVPFKRKPTATPAEPFPPFPPFPPADPFPPL
ncbi:MAG: hypothetical protein KDE33_25535, partial [Bacteroidetes bacterium]|nr:hypothetical protein [Bacteroidota bacterium]